MQWWLNVFFMINGIWVPGSDLDGWYPRAYASEQECAEHKASAERSCRERPLEYEAAWFCTFAEPMREAPVHMRGDPCRVVSLPGDTGRDG